MSFLLFAVKTAPYFDIKNIKTDYQNWLSVWTVFGSQIYKGGNYKPPWKVREITSSCCSFVNLLKFTAYPETLTVN